MPTLPPGLVPNSEKSVLALSDVLPLSPSTQQQRKEGEPNTLPSGGPQQQGEGEGVIPKLRAACSVRVAVVYLSTHTI